VAAKAKEVAAMEASNKDSMVSGSSRNKDNKEEGWVNNRNMAASSVNRDNKEDEVRAALASSLAEGCNTAVNSKDKI
jgi:hypothetical protein